MAKKKKKKKKNIVNSSLDISEQVFAQANLDYN